MGGKREVRRCTSLMDDGRKFSDETRQISEDLLLRAESLRKTNARKICPVTIHIDACTSDDDNDNVDEKSNDRTVDNTENKAADSVQNRAYKPSKRHVTFLTPNENDVCDHVTLILTSPRDPNNYVTDSMTVVHSSNLPTKRPDKLNLREANRDSNTFKSGFFVSPSSAHSPLSSPTSARLLPNSPTTAKRSSPKSATMCRGISPNSPTFGRQNSPNFLEVPEECHLSLVKKATVRLNLRTRTPSFLEWRSKWLESPRAPPEIPVPPKADDTAGKGEKLTEDRKKKINDALQWLKSELREMQSVDQHLARQLLSLRHDMQQMRLRNSCQLHRDLLDDVQSEFEEQEELSDVLDLPKTATLNDTPLKHLGVTRMNLSTRRFSTC